MKHLLTCLTLALAALTGCSGKTGGTSAAAPQGGAAEAAAQPTLRADADTLFSLVERQVALGPRNPGSQGHARCVELIESTLRGYGADTVTVLPFTAATFDGTVHNGRNIFARINPSATSRTLLLAHFDTRPWADSDPDPKAHDMPVTGANDGASGVAVLLEAARLAAPALPDSLGLDLLFVDLEDSGYSGGGPESEETWCLGTQEWVKNLPYSDADLPRQAILFDMVGGADARFHQEYFSVRSAPGLVNRFWETARKSGFADRFPRQVGGGVVDDHIFVCRAGIPCIDVIENYNSATGSFNPTWHTTADNLANIDREILRIVTQTLLDFLTAPQQ